MILEAAEDRFGAFKALADPMAVGQRLGLFLYIVPV